MTDLVQAIAVVVGLALVVVVIAMIFAWWDHRHE